MFITNGGIAAVALVMARTGGPGAKGVSAFLVPTDSAGSRRAGHGKLGLAPATRRAASRRRPVGRTRCSARGRRASPSPERPGHRPDLLAASCTGRRRHASTRCCGTPGSGSSSAAHRRLPAGAGAASRTPPSTSERSRLLTWQAAA
jgi:hypothetical protein